VSTKPRQDNVEVKISHYDYGNPTRGWPSCCSRFCSRVWVSLTIQLCSLAFNKLSAVFLTLEHFMSLGDETTVVL